MVRQTPHDMRRTSRLRFHPFGIFWHQPDSKSWNGANRIYWDYLCECCGDLSAKHLHVYKAGKGDQEHLSCSAPDVSGKPNVKCGGEIFRRRKFMRTVEGAAIGAFAGILAAVLTSVAFALLGL